VDLGYGSWWLLPIWHASQTDSLFDLETKGSLFLFNTCWTMVVEGWPRRACHRDARSLVTPWACLLVD
jgi:hypothetical protein